MVAEATPDELAEAAWRLNHAGTWAGIRADPTFTSRAARLAGRVVGSVPYAHCPEYDGTRAGHWLHLLTVWRPCRGLGIGEAVVRDVKAGRRERGADEFRLVVKARDARAVRLYRKLGYARIAVPALELASAKSERQTGRRGVVTCRKPGSS